MAELHKKDEAEIRRLMTHYGAAFNDERHDPRPKADAVIDKINQVLTELEEALY